MLEGFRFAGVIAVLAGVTIGSATSADAVVPVPTYPCYKCQFNGNLNNPNSECEQVNTEWIFDYGTVTCTTYGNQGGGTTCESSGDVCWWLMPIAALTGTGLPGGGLGVVAEADGELHNCRGAVLAWGSDRSASAELGELTI